MANTLQERLRHSFDRFPANPAIEGEGRTVSYAELESVAASSARAMHERGILPGAHVGVLFESRAETPWRRSA
jgi:non-ribosomal peptide synthetase component E (peptide arylation enzyme)